MMKKPCLYLQLTLLLVSACIPVSGHAVRYGAEAPVALNSAAATPVTLNSAQKTRADMLISVFENSSLTLQYGYVEDLNDGRGYTAGRAGFCTGCGDLLLAAERYQAAKPGNPLSKYLPRLRELAELESDSTAGLDGFPAAWELAAEDPLFRAAQDAVSDELYYSPALAYARKLGLKKALSLTALYEASIQHGTGDDPDGLGAMIGRASKAARPPSAGGAESAWLEQFLKVRKATLANASNPATREEWAESEGRADAMLEIFASGNMDLSGPVTVNPFGTQFTIP